MPGVDDLPRLEITSRAAWRSWLEAHHAEAEGIWLVLFKKHVGEGYVPWGDLVREALCFGWIDARTRSVDADRTSLLVVPRKPGSTWSAVNKRHIEELEAAGAMTPAGRALIDAAKADGSWTFLDDIEALIEPDDLRAALDDEPSCREAWDGTAPSRRKLALFSLKSAKRAATRDKRREAILDRLRRGEPAA